MIKEVVLVPWPIDGLATTHTMKALAYAYISDHMEWGDHREIVHAKTYIEKNLDVKVEVCMSVETLRGTNGKLIIGMGRKMLDTETKKFFNILSDSMTKIFIGDICE